MILTVEALEDTELEYVWFQQDSYLAHNASIIKEYLQRFFEDHLLDGVPSVSFLGP